MISNEKSKYDIQAEEFLNKTKTEFKINFLKWDLYFFDDKEKRDIYEVVLKRGEREFKFKFGNSLNASGEYILLDKERTHIHLNKSFNGKPNKNIKGFGLLNNGNSQKNKNFKIPNAYDILAGLTKYEVGSLKDFCDSYGYNEDSIKVIAIYNAVINEWNNIKMLYSDEEIKLLQEIN